MTAGDPRALLDRGQIAAELPDRLVHLRSAANLAEGRLDGDVVAYARHVLDKAAERLTFGTHHSVVALLGATGSGKSSMANAIAGSEIATTGVRRPTTNSTLACVWGPHDASALLDWLQVKNRHLVGDGPPEFDGLVLLDVPDHDSVKVEHRLEMERIAEHADLLLFVTDPEKYADEALHHYLRLLNRHGAVTAVVLNKADTLTRDQLQACRADLARLLLEDGVGDATVLTASATTGLGLNELNQLLATLIEEKQLALARLDADATVAASDLAAAAGPPLPTRLSRAIGNDLAQELVDASGLEVISDAVGKGYRRDAAAAMGWPVTRWVRRLRPHPLRRLHLGAGSAGPTSLPAPGPASSARVAAAVRTAADRSTAELPEPWPTLVRQAALRSTPELHTAVDTAIARAVRDRARGTPRWWAPIKGLQGLLFAGMLVGIAWLVALAAVGFFALGEIQTPEIGPVPVPTVLALGGAAAGWLVSVIAARLARLGARRRAAVVRRDAAGAMVSVAHTHVLDPIESELASRRRLTDELAAAGARWPEGLR